MATGTIRPAPEFLTKSYNFSGNLAAGAITYAGATGITGYTCISMYLTGLPAAGYFILCSNPSYSAGNDNWVGRIKNEGDSALDMTGWSAKFVFVRDGYLHPVN